MPVEFVCQRSDLARGIATVERAVSSRDSMPVLEGILIRAESDRLLLVATDLEMSIECYVPARVRQTGETVLGGKVLGQIARKLAGDEVVYTTEDNQTARIESGRSRFTVHTMDPEDFPTLPDVDEESMWRISQAQMRKMIRHTSFAAAADDSRPFLTGVFVEVEGDDICFVATDSSRLSHYKGKLIEPAKSATTGIVPVRSLTELMRLLEPDDESEIEFTVTPNQAVFCLAGVRVISRVIEGQFPDYRRVFPSEKPTQLRVGRQEFLDALERVSLIAKRNTPIVRIKVQEGLLSLTTNEAEIGQAFEEINVVQDGSDRETAYQARYLLDVLRAMDAEDVEMGLGEGLKQGSLRSVEDEAFTYIVMPVRVG